MSNIQSSLAMYLQQIGQFKLLTAEEELELGRRIRDEHDEDARQLLIQSNLRLVVSVAKPFRARGNHNIPLEDLIAEGNQGLIAAVDKYDYNLGYRFSTCAVPWIKQAIMKSIVDNSRTIRIPAHIIQLFNKYKKAEEEISAETGGVASEEDIARRMGITLDKLHDLLEWKQNSISLETPLGDDGDTISDVMPDTHSQTPAEYANQKDRDAFVRKLLSELDNRTAIIFKLRFGLGTDEDPAEYRVEHTLEEIGGMLTPKITRERVRQIVAQQLARWKTKYADKKLF